MTKPEKLIVPKDLGDWLDTRDIGNKELMFILIDGLREQVDEEFSGKTREFVFDYKKEIVEVLIGNRDYEIEEPLVYALIKGHELSSNNLKYWHCEAYHLGRVLIGAKHPKQRCINRMTKKNWKIYGINESNADFEEVQG